MANWLSQRGSDIQDLGFITAIFTWIFNLLSRVAEPLMTLGVIYTIIVAGIPSAYNAGISYVATAAMIGSPEIILPGAFIIAGQEKANGNKKAWMLLTVCCFFVVLTALTLADLFIFHFSRQGTSILMCVRCVTGVSYSIIVRIVHSGHGHGGSQGHGGSGGNGGPGSQPQPPFDPEAFMREVHEIVNQASRELTETVRGSQGALVNQASLQFAETVQGSQQQFAKQWETRLQSVLARIEAGSNGPESTHQANQLHLLTGGQHLTSRQLLGTHPERVQTGYEGQGRAIRNSQADQTQPTYEVQGNAVLNVALSPEATIEKVHTTQVIPSMNPGEVQTTPFMNPGEVHMSTRVSREQVIAFIVNYWTVNKVKPKLQIIQDATGCSKGQASFCCNQVAPQFGATIITETEE